MKYNINQYQDIFFINGCVIIVDYLLGTLEIIEKWDKKAEVNFINSSLYNAYEKRFSELQKQMKNEEELTVVLIPSYRCNMECEYCYEGHQKRKSKVMSYVEKNEIIEMISQKYLKKINFVLLGGEPIYGENLYFFKEFFCDVKNTGLNYQISCVSNGLEIIDNFGIIKEIGISRFQITIDGLEEVHNRRKKSKISGKNPFKEACHSISKLLENNIEVDLRINIDQYNANQINGIAELIQDRGWNEEEGFTAYIYPVTYSGNDEKKEYFTEVQILKRVLEIIKPEYEELFELDFHGIEFINTILSDNIFVPKTQFCASCINQMVFDGNGNIYTCWWGANNKTFSVGKYQNQQLEVNNQQLEAWKKHSVNTIKKCISCKYRYICGGGCVFKAYLNHGNLNDGNCAEFYEIINTYLQFKLEKNKIYQRLLNCKFEMIKEFLNREKFLSMVAEGNSMEPAVNSGEKIVISSDLSNLKIGDIVLYVNWGELKLHRITEVKENDFYTLKGDNEDYCEDVHICKFLGKKVKHTIYKSYTGKMKCNAADYQLLMSIKNSEIIDIEVRRKCKQ